MKVDINFYDENGKGLKLNNLSDISKRNVTTDNAIVVMSKENGEFTEELTFNISKGEIRFIPLEKNNSLKDPIFNLNRTKLIGILNNMVKCQENLDKEEIVDILDTMSKDLQKMKEEI